MKVNGDHYHSIWYDKNLDKVKIIDQRLLPYEFKIITLETLKDFENAINWCNCCIWYCTSNA